MQCYGSPFTNQDKKNKKDNYNCFRSPNLTFSVKIMRHIFPRISEFISRISVFFFCQRIKLVIVTQVFFCLTIASLYLTVPTLYLTIFSELWDKSSELWKKVFFMFWSHGRNKLPYNSDATLKKPNAFMPLLRYETGLYCNLIFPCLDCPFLFIFAQTLGESSKKKRTSRKTWVRLGAVKTGSRKWWST